MSTIQYMFGLAAKRERNPNSYGLEKFFDIMFGTELWRLLLLCFTMDLPFFIMRVYIWARYETTSKNYTLYFLLAKNFLTVVFLAKKIVNIVLEEMPKRTKVNANESYTDMSDKAA